MTPQTGTYPANWKEIARRVKDEAEWTCIRCEHPHDVESGHVLTVHHLDGNKSNCEWWNLTALCQRCHLQIQHKVEMNRFWMFEHSEWFRPYVAGYYAALLGMRTCREFVVEHYDRIMEKATKMEWEEQ